MMDYTSFLLIIYYLKTAFTNFEKEEFIALKTCVESISALRFKLRMFGIPLNHNDSTHEDDAAYIFCDNETVVKNSTRMESMLNKKHSSIAYHFVRWNVAAGIITLSWIMSTANLADAFTKLLSQTVRENLFSQWTY